MERIRGKESISAQEHDSTLSNVRFKFYGMSLLLLAYEVLDIVPKCTQLNGSLFLFFYGFNDSYCMIYKQHRTQAT